MKTIVKDKENTIVINKSKFICFTYKINDIEEIDRYMAMVKSKYKDATHYCYAYILGSFKKCSDDREPSGTAGMPILNVLEKNELDNILCIVVRYFGGVKLGAGGLVRAYGGSVVECLKDNIKKIEYGYRLELVFSYDKVKLVDSLFSNIISKEFNENIKYIALIKDSDYELIKDKLSGIEVNIIEEKIVI